MVERERQRDGAAAARRERPGVRRRRDVDAPHLDADAAADAQLLRDPRDLAAGGHLDAELADLDDRARLFALLFWFWGLGWVGGESGEEERGRRELAHERKRQTQCAPDRPTCRPTGRPRPRRSRWRGGAREPSRIVEPRVATDETISRPLSLSLAAPTSCRHFLGLQRSSLTIAMRVSTSSFSLFFVLTFSFGAMAAAAARAERLAALAPVAVAYVLRFSRPCVCCVAIQRGSLSVLGVGVSLCVFACVWASGGKAVLLPHHRRRRSFLMCRRRRRARRGRRAAGSPLPPKKQARSNRVQKSPRLTAYPDRAPHYYSITAHPSLPPH